MLKRKRTTGQALVEFALAATLIFFLLAAVVDLSLIFMTLQSLHNAAQEGATFGSRWLTDTGQLDIAQIRDRARHESGDWSAARAGNFVNLLDLDNNNQEDSQAVIDKFITAEALLDPSDDGNPEVNANPSGAPACIDGTCVPAGGKEHFVCANPGQAQLHNCYLIVKVAAIRHVIFPLAPVLTDEIRLESSYTMLIRSGFTQGGAGGNPPSFRTATPLPATPTVIPPEVEVVTYKKHTQSNTIRVKLRITKDSSPVNGATVQVAVNGQTYSLSSAGNGYYSNCTIPASGSLSAGTYQATVSGASTLTGDLTSTGNANDCP